MLMRPLISRELLRECRHRVHFIGRSLLVAALAGIVLWRWQEAGRPTSLWGPSGVYRYERAIPAMMARYGTMLFGIWAVLQYVGVCVFSMVRSAAVADERRSGSLPLLQITRLSSGGVILGSFVSVMGRALFTMLLALPVLVIARSFGGFTMEQVAMVSVVTVVAAAHVAALTLFIASRSSGTGAAIAIAVVLQGVWLLVMAFPDVSEFVCREAPALNALTFVLEVTDGARYAAPHLGALIASRLGLTAVYLALAVALLGRPAWRPGRRIKRALVAADGFFMRISRRRVILWRGGLGPCKRNPILWRERAASLMGQRDHMIRLLYWAMLGFIAVLLVLAPFIDDMALLAVAVAGMVMVPLLVFAIFLVVRPATAFARERQQRTLALLAVTPLSAGRIVIGKYVFGLRMLWVPVVLMAIFFGCTMYVDGVDDMGPDAPLMLLSLLALAPMLLSQILYVGAGARTSVQGIAAGAVLFAGAILFGHPDPRWDLLGKIVPDGLFEMSSVEYLPAIACAAAAALLARRRRLVTNAAFLGLLIVGSLWLGKALGLGDLRLWNSRVFPDLVPMAAIVGSAVTLLVLVSIVLRRYRVARNLVIWTILVVAGLAATQIFAGATWWLFSLAVAAAWWRAARYAGPGIVNRTALALLAPWIVHMLMRPLLYREEWWQSGFPVVVVAIETPPYHVILIAQVLLVAVVFLAATVRQLDRLMERNG